MYFFENISAYIEKLSRLSRKSTIVIVGIVSNSSRDCMHIRHEVATHIHQGPECGARRT